MTASSMTVIRVRAYCEDCDREVYSRVPGRRNVGANTPVQVRCQECDIPRSAKPVEVLHNGG